MFRARSGAHPLPCVYASLGACQQTGCRSSDVERGKNECRPQGTRALTTNRDNSDSVQCTLPNDECPVHLGLATPPREARVPVCLKHSTLTAQQRSRLGAHDAILTIYLTRSRHSAQSSELSAAIVDSVGSSRVRTTAAAPPLVCARHFSAQWLTKCMADRQIVVAQYSLFL